MGLSKNMGEEREIICGCFLNLPQLVFLIPSVVWMKQNICSKCEFLGNLHYLYISENEEQEPQENYEVLNSAGGFQKNSKK